MYGIVKTKQFERSFKKLKASGVYKTLESVVDLLAAGKALPISCKDHKLNGNLQQYRECHIRGDLLLVYQKQKEHLILVLVDIGSHSYLFL